MKIDPARMERMGFQFKSDQWVSEYDYPGLPKVTYYAKPMFGSSATLEVVATCGNVSIRQTFIDPHTFTLTRLHNAIAAILGK